MPPATYRIIYENGAIEDLNNIVKWYDEINPDLKQKIQQSIKNAEKSLLKNPFAFAKTSLYQFRRILLPLFLTK